MENDIFYIIFDYLNIFDIYESFSNLNKRFQNLITCSKFLMKIKLSSDTTAIFEARCKHIITPNIHRLTSLHFRDTVSMDKFFAQYMIDSSFIALQSIVVHGISEHKLLILLFYINTLPQVFSLTIGLNETFDIDPGTIYRMIFHLPVLNYLKMAYPIDKKNRFLCPSYLLPTIQYFETSNY